MVLMIALVLQKKISINLSKANTKFGLSLHYNGDQSYLYLNKTEICKFKVNDEQSEISLNDMVYDFFVDHSSIKKQKHT